MAHTEQEYRDAASALPSRFLGGRFSQSGLDDAAVSAIHRITLFKDNAELMGLAGGSVESIQKRGNALAKAITAAQEAKAQKEKSSTDDMIFLDLMQRINELSEQLAETRQRNRKLEDEMKAEYGDDYLEDLAQMYLDDDALNALSGLSPEEREKQIRAMLMDKILNEDDSIKEEYKGTKIGELAKGWKKEQDIADRMDALEKAQESGDPEQARKALADDNLTKEVAEQVTREQSGLTLTDAYGSAANPKHDQLAKAIEEQDVVEDVSPHESVSSIEAFGNI